MQIKKIYSIRKQMEKNHRKVEVFRKKKEKFSLTKEEEKKLKDLLQESFILSDELIEAHMDVSVFPHVLDADAHVILKEIKENVNWNGGLVRRKEEFDKIAEVEKDLTDEEREEIKKMLSVVHESTLKNFEYFCSSEEGWTYMNNVSKIFNEEGNMLDLLTYIDARFRELGELLGFELDELEIVWDGDEEE